jgi:sec-independent protein translocase protein TatB
MFNLGAGEIAVILVVALLLLGPDKLPELARGIGKFMREFRRQTDDVRGLVEREFYKMDTEVFAEDSVKRIEAPKPEATASVTNSEGTALPAPEYPSVFPPPEGVVASHPQAAVPAPVEAPVAPPPTEGEPKAHG